MRSLSILLAIFLSFVIVTAQNNPQALEKSPPAKEDKFTEIHNQIKSFTPFQPNEELTYELKLSRFPIYGTIGQLKFTVTEENAIPKDFTKEETLKINNSGDVKPENSSPASLENTTPKLETPKLETPINSTGNWKFLIEAKSKGILTSIFRINVNDTFTSYVNKNDFKITKHVKRIEEGKRRREMVSDFDQTKQKVKWIDTDLNTNQVVRSKEKVTPNWFTDIISGWYVMRAQSLSIGKKFSFPLSDDAEIYEIEVEVEGTEKLESDFGKFSTLKLEMKIFDGKYIRRKGTLHIWVTDDSRHLPLRAQIKSSFGTVNINLVEMKNVKTNL
jgi:hypothetical protein